MQEPLGGLEAQLEAAAIAEAVLPPSSAKDTIVSLLADPAQIAEAVQTSVASFDGMNGRRCSLCSSCLPVQSAPACSLLLNAASWSACLQLLTALLSAQRLS